jgi:anti-sigma B factor antagonist
MKLQTEKRGPVAIASLSGRFDAHETSKVISWIEENRRTGFSKIVFNLDGVQFIDSTALTVLVQGVKGCQEQRGDLRICCLRQPVKIIFELTSLDQKFGIYANQEQAVCSFLE